jgi:nicotinamide-nucleotide amidase
VPLLRERYQLGIIKARVLKTAGIGESILDETIGKPLLEASNPTVGLAAHSGQVDVRITAKASSEVEADQMIAEVEAQLMERIGDYVFGYDDETIEEALIHALQARGAKVAISETGINSAISSRLKGAPDVEQVLADVWSYPHPDDLRVVLSAPDDLPIRQLAEMAAEAASRKANAEVGIAVVCQPDMDEQHADAEQGTAIAVYTAEKSRSRAYGFGGQSETAREWSGTWSMSMAWRMLRENAVR